MILELFLYESTSTIVQERRPGKSSARDHVSKLSSALKPADRPTRGCRPGGGFRGSGPPPVVHRLSGIGAGRAVVNGGRAVGTSPVGRRVGRLGTAPIGSGGRGW